jgi:hypothetical protein
MQYNNISHPTTIMKSIDGSPCRTIHYDIAGAIVWFGGTSLTYCTMVTNAFQTLHEIASLLVTVRENTVCALCRFGIKQIVVEGLAVTTA